MGKLYLEKFLTYPVSFEYSHEFIHKLHVLNPKVLLIAVSQSGETADTLHCVEMANAVGCQVIAFCNRSHSLMARLSTKTIDLMCGPEHSVASTKTFTSSIFNFYLFSISVAKSRGLLMRAEYNQLIGEVRKTALFIRETSQEKNAAAALASMLAKFNSLYFIGRKWLLPMALEAAHKCKELTYLHAEGYPSAELKHGAISMIGSDFPTVILVSDDETIERMVATAKEIKARSGILYIVGPQKLSEQFKFADSYFAVPAHIPDLQPIVTNIFLQYMNYFLALKLERNVDQPRNLAKTVTVE